MARKIYVGVPTAAAERHPDMVRYMGYCSYARRSDGSTDHSRYDRFVPESAAPIDAGSAGTGDWPAHRHVTLHRFTRDGQTWFRQPGSYANTWADGIVARWASFGVRAVTERMDF